MVPLHLRLPTHSSLVTGVGKEDPDLEPGADMERPIPCPPHHPTAVKVSSILHHTWLKETTEDSDR